MLNIIIYNKKSNKIIKIIMKLNKKIKKIAAKINIKKKIR